MSRLPIVDFKTMNSLLLTIGFEVVRQKGSHVFYRHQDGRTTTVLIMQGGIYLGH
jgi:predicted RNA binding protein YcfA (HicA-like mRNA interferase family)